MINLEEKKSQSSSLIKDKHVQQLYTTLLSLLDGEKLTSSNIMSITVQLMQFVEKYPHIKGPERKSIVLNVIKQLVIDTMDPSNQETKDIMSILDLTLPIFIDTIISVDRGELIIHSKQCFNSLFSCCN